MRTDSSTRSSESRPSESKLASPLTSASVTSKPLSSVRIVSRIWSLVTAVFSVNALPPLICLLSGHSAVDTQHLSRDRRRIVGCEEGDRRTDLVRLHRTSDRYRL